MNDEIKANVYDDFEKNYWWFLGRRKIIYDYMLKYIDLGIKINCLDIGCGTGAILLKLKNIATQRVGLDISQNRLLKCGEKGVTQLIRADAALLPIKKISFNLVTALDVIEHIENDVEILKEFKNIIKSGGILILTVPAYQFLFSPYADAQHKRRYTKTTLLKCVEEAGFKIETIHYFNSLLFPLMLIERLHERFFVKKRESFEIVFNKLPQTINTLFSIIFNIERLIIKLGLKFPFGGSIICICKKCVD